MVLPFVFLASIGMAILYNFGTNIFLGQISYITQAIAAVLQLGVKFGEVRKEVFMGVLFNLLVKQKQQGRQHQHHGGNLSSGGTTPPPRR